LKVRREALSSQLVVTNHHLTFADFVSGGEIAIGAGNIVFDEAHNLEKVAASYLGNVIDKRMLDGSLAGMYASRPRQSGFLVSLKAALALDKPDDALIDTIEKVIDAITNLNYASARFFEALLLKTQALTSSSEAREIAYTSAANPCAIVERDELITTIDDLLEKTDTLIANLREENSIIKRREAVIRLEAFFSDLKSFSGQAEDVLHASSPDYVYWIEKPSSARYSPRLLSAPLDVGSLLDKRFYDHLKTAVFSSATLSIDRKFDYIIQRLGLDLESKDRLSSICLDSPFDIDSQVAVISAGYLPSPKRPDFDQAANQSLSEILLAGARKAMVLFTSYRSLRNSIEMLSKTLENAGMELFQQEGSFSSERVLRRFKSSKKAVLFGTDTFWEGVDLPGELLELLVLFKFPFTVPDRPWFKANLERIERSGESSFAKLSLPEAVVKFRQGFGRLIRTSNDRGCVVILDSRVETTSFGPIFLNSVRGEKFRSRSSDEIAALIRNWLG
jgi:Rad3-related DNA helicase